MIRPAQWVKNVFVFAALAFSNKLTDLHAVTLAAIAFAGFCACSSAGYVFNDILDRERDRHHPTKKLRPLASGEISPVAAVQVILLLLGAGVLCMACLPLRFAVALVGYFLLSLAYSLKLKHHMLVDVIAIAMLFVMRAVGGATAIQVTVSPWLLVCTFMLCLFLGFGKRRCEITMLGSSDAIRDHRRTLTHYTPDLLNQLLSTSGGIAIVTFLLYTLDTTSSPFGTDKHRLMYTLPLVVYGIYRYAMLIELGKAVGPTELILHDRAFQLTLLAWIASAMFMLYWPAIHRLLTPLLG